MLLADLLSAAAAHVAEIEMEEPDGEAAAREKRGDSPAAAAISRAREAAEPQPSWAAAILSARRSQRIAPVHQKIGKRLQEETCRTYSETLDIAPEQHLSAMHARTTLPGIP
ncbi:unnamed protein product [Lampetra planeri]